MRFGKKIISCVLTTATLFSMMALSSGGTASAVSKPSVVKNLTITQKGSGKLVLKWNKAQNASGYEVTYSSDKNFKKNVKSVIVKGNSNVKYTTPKISGACYTKVRAYKTVNGKKQYGANSNKAATYVISLKDFGDEKNQKIKVWVPEECVSITKEQCNSFADKFAQLNIKFNVKAVNEDSAAIYLRMDPDESADVFTFHSNYISTLSKEGLITPIPKKIANTVKVTDTKKSIDASKIEGTLYSYPKTYSGYYLVYDKRIVSKKQAKTLEGVLKACKEKNKKFIMEAYNGYYSCVFAFTGGVKTNGLKGNTQKFTNYNEKTAVATLKAFSKLMHKYSGTFISKNVERIGLGFQKGTCGAGIDGCWNSGINKEALGKNLGATKLPTITVNGKKRQMISMMGYRMFGVNTHSLYPRTSQLLAYYLSSKECQLQRAKSLGMTPTNKEVINSKTLKNDVTMLALYEQGKHSVQQKDISGTFWDPMAQLGIELYKNNNPDTYNYKKLLKNTILNIKDQW